MKTTNDVNTFFKLFLRRLAIGLVVKVPVGIPPSPSGLPTLTTTAGT